MLEKELLVCGFGLLSCKAAEILNDFIRNRNCDLSSFPLHTEKKPFMDCHHGLPDDLRAAAGEANTGATIRTAENKDHSQVVESSSDSTHRAGVCRPSLPLEISDSGYADTGGLG